MIPIEFKEQNFILGKPKDMTDSECVPLPCFRDGQQVVSKWELTEEEKAHVAEHGFIWCQCYSGNSQPPIGLSARETVFYNPAEKMQGEVDDIFKEGKK